MPQDPIPEPPAPIQPSVERGPERMAIDIALRLVALAALAWLALVLIRPFLPLLVWTCVIAAALHPVYGWLGARLGDRPRLAAVLVTAAALMTTLGPIAVLMVSLIETAELIAMRARGGTLTLPDPPPALLDLPVIGQAVSVNWDLATTNVEGFLARYRGILLGAGERAARPALHFAEGMLTLLAAVALSGFLHLPGRRLGAALRRASDRVAGPRGAVFVAIAADTIRNVARGVIGVAVIQAVLIGVGLIVGRVPGAGVLTLAALVLAIVQIGAWPVVFAVLAWAWFERGLGPAAMLALYLAPVSVLDIALKPLMLAGSHTTPTLVIFAGVIGGTLAYGLVGLFVGPILLAIVYELLRFGLYHDDRRGDGRGGTQ